MATRQSSTKIDISSSTSAFTLSITSAIICRHKALLHRINKKRVSSPSFIIYVICGFRQPPRTSVTQNFFFPLYIRNRSVNF